MKKILIFVLALSCLTSCREPTKEFLRSYVMYYNDAEEMVLTDVRSTSANGVYIDFQRFRTLGSYKSTGELKESYDALCEKHNDMTFSREVVTWDGGGPKITKNLGIDFLSIDMISDSDFDLEHPAETSIGNIVKFKSQSLKPYIDSGYVLLNSYGGVYHPIEGLVSEMTPEQLTLLGNGGHIGTLIFETQPTLSKSHTFTVTMTADDGRVFTASIDMEFE